jgi:hypothetical protein
VVGRRIALVTAIVALLAAGCWEQPGFDSGGSGASPLPVGVNATNVGSLQPVFTAPAEGLSSGTHSVISLGHLFVTGDHLSSFDASGGTGCSGAVPRGCTPQWVSVESMTSSDSIVVGGGRLWAVTNAGISGYDVAGEQGCSGTPRRCTAVVTIPVTGVASALRWVGDSLHATIGIGPIHQFTLSHHAFGADGTERWQAPLGGSQFGPYGSGTVGAGDVVFVSTVGNGVLAFDAAGTTGCAGNPEVCTPLRRYDGATNAVVAGGRLYANVAGGFVAAYDAAGVAGCGGAPTVCEPLWTTSQPGDSQVITADHLYVALGDHLAAYSLGTTGCTGAPLVCSPQWTGAPTGSPYTVTGLSVAGGVVYAVTYECPGGNCVTPTVRVEAFDAAGQLNCGGAPRVCTPRWSTTVPFPAEAPIVVGGTVYVTGVYSPGPAGPQPYVTAYRPASG